MVLRRQSQWSLSSRVTPNLTLYLSSLLCIRTDRIYEYILV
jgi:hypothetical protein